MKEPCIGGNYSATINGMTAATGNFTAEVKRSQKWTETLTGALARFDYLNNVVQNVANGVDALSGAGIKLDSQMHDLSAVAGVTGDGLKQIEGFARESAKAFGTDAAVAVEGYKLLLSQLSPELGKYPEALSAMGDCIETTSKLMGGDGVAAAQVLTTAMNQYGVSLEDPMAASEEMARMMNVMAAAGQAGSAELPAISAAMQQCGMAAKGAGVSFEETNAAIQVLDKAGKKASEGGVALRNVLGQLSKGRFVEKSAREELEKAGIDVEALGDNSKSLKERLEMLKPMLNDSALLSKFFGVENANAARALIQGTDALQDYTVAVTGTNSATEQAAVVMDSYAERQARVNQKIEDMKISVFEATGDLTIWCSTLSQSFIPLTQLAPAFTIAGGGVKWFAKTASGGFAMFSHSAVGACRSVSVAIGSIPIVGWIALLVSLIGFLCVKFEWARYAVLALTGGIGGLLVIALKQLYDHFYGVRVVVHTWIEVIKAWWGFLWETLQRVVAAVKEAAERILASVRQLWMSITEMVGRIVETIRRVIESVKILINGLVSYIRSAMVVAINTIERISGPIANAFKGIASGIKGFFIEIFDWIYDKYGDFINSIVRIYNRLAEQLGWDKIKALGKDAAARSWRKDHGSKGVVGSGKESGSNVVGSGSDGGGVSDVPEIPNPVGSSLGRVSSGGMGGTGSDGGGVGKIRNITINIEKLIERMELHTTTLSEGTERMKEIVTEALLGALNDTQIATE